jgi:hypothetical protein
MELIGRGDVGLYVKTLQIQLNKALKGQNGIEKLAVDGEFGVKTEAALLAYQKQKDLRMDGVAGRETWTALLGRYINWVYIHTTDSLSSASFADIEAYHQSLGWSVGGYHFLYDGQGQEKQCYPLKTMTNGVLGLNEDAIHLAYIGGRLPRTEYWPKKQQNLIKGLSFAIPNNDSQINCNTLTEGQKKAMEKRVKALLAEMPHLQILGHHQAPKFRANAKLCPLFDTRDLAKEWGILKENIYARDTWGMIGYLKTGVWYRPAP